MLPKELIKKYSYKFRFRIFAKSSKNAFDAFQYNSFLNQVIHTFRSRRENPEIQHDLIDCAPYL